MFQDTKLQLTIQPSPCKLDELKLSEHIDINILNSLITSTLLKQEFHNPLSTHFYENEKSQLIKYKQLIHNGKASVKYNKAKNMKYGRVSPFKSLGLFSIRRELRHTLARDNYIDIDIENCHPVLLLQILQANGIECKYLKKYVTNRDEIFEEVKAKYNVSRDEAKVLFIQLMYYGSFDSWYKKLNKQSKQNDGFIDTDENDGTTSDEGNNDNKPTKFIMKFSKELQQIGDIIVSKNTELKNQIKKRKQEQHKTDYNEKATICSYFLQEYECQILETIYLYCIDKKYITNNNAVLCMDGLMIPKENYKPELLQELHELIKHKNGFNLKFTDKAMNQCYSVEQIKASQVPISEQVELLLNEGVFNDLDAAKVVYKLFPHWVCCNEELYVFDNSTGLWSSNEQAHMKVISKFEKHLYLMVPTKDGDYKVSTKGYGNSTALQRQMIPQLKTLCINNLWIQANENTSLGKLLYLDGWLNLGTGEFNETFSPNILFMCRIQANYKQEDDVNYMNDIQQRIFLDPLGKEEGDYLLLSIARAIAGDQLKRIIFGLGGTNGGKSTVTKALLNSFGDYVSTFNAENLVYNNNSSDEAAKLRWAFLMRYTRLIISNELKKGVDLNGNDIKKISSGGDQLVGRIHGGLETKFTPHFMAIVLANDIPTITPYDDAVNNRLNVVRFSKKFVEEPTNEYELKMDANLDNELRTETFQYHFMKLVINRYIQFVKDGRVDIIPQAVANAKVEWIGDDNDTNVMSKFMNEFQITNNTDHYIESNNIQTWLECQKLGISFKKFSIELKKYITINKYEFVESKNKKLNGRVSKVWTGIKYIDDETEFTSQV